MLRKVLVISFCFILSSSLMSQKSDIGFPNWITGLQLPQELMITDNYTSQGITHIYAKEAINGISIEDSRVSVHFRNAEKTANYHTNQLAYADKFRITNTLQMDAIDAINNVLLQKGYDQSNDLIKLTVKNQPNQDQKIDGKGVSLQEIPARLQYLVTDKEALTLVWDIAIEHVDNAQYINYFVDAATGEILREVSWTLSCNFGTCNHQSHNTNHHHATDKVGELHQAVVMDSNRYNVYAWPVESPNFGDRSIQIAPWNDNITASPVGWHQYGNNTFTTTRGNNVDAYLDANNTNSPNNGDADRADGGGALNFDFPINLNQAPSQYRPAAITNLFYWNNVSHDVWWNYGFDEASGNFQEENFGEQGEESDYVRAEAQDGGGNCNANFSTPPDGNNPRMQMYTCNLGSPDRDGDLDNGVIVHEYGHGISIRLTGGPSTSGCLTGQEQMGEGWSDWFGVVMTIQEGDTGTDSRPMGTWLFGQGPNGDGIRPAPYNTDLAVNDLTYETVISGNLSVPHGVGSVWATILWDLTWALIDEYGFDPDIYNGTGGNNIAMKLVIEGIKLQPCGPGFVDGRNAILQADELLYDGVNKCLIWEVFARRGLGFSAFQGSSAVRNDGVAAYDRPQSCLLTLDKIVDQTNAASGDTLDYSMKIINVHTDTISQIEPFDPLPNFVEYFSSTQSGTLINDTVKWPLVALAPGDSVTYSFKGIIDSTMNPIGTSVTDGFEDGLYQWDIFNSGSSAWQINTTTVYEGSQSLFANDGSSSGIAELILASPKLFTDSTELSFYHWYDTEPTWDGGLVQISLDGGSSWQDLGDDMIQNGYNSTIYNSIPGFSGNSNGFIETIVDLSPYANQNGIIRFQMNCDQFVGGNGWYLDQIKLDKLGAGISNTFFARNDSILVFKEVDTLTVLSIEPNSLQAEFAVIRPTCFGDEDGTLAIIPQGGSGTYTYLWENGSQDSVRTDLASGSYLITISDGVSQIVRSFEMEEKPPIEIDFDVQNTSEMENDGAVTASVSGGAPIYSYLWENGATVNTIDNLTENFYSLTVTDNKGCTKIDSAFVDNPLTCDLEYFQLTINLDQYPEETSFVLINENDETVASGGPYGNQADGSTVTEYFCLQNNSCFTFIIYDTFGDGICGPNSNPDGFYEIKHIATDSVIANNCAFGSVDTVVFCNPVYGYNLGVDAQITEISCDGSQNGSITVTANGGDGPYSYKWGSGINGQTINNLTEGWYTITITDPITSLDTAFYIPNAKTTMVRSEIEGNPYSLRNVVATNCPNDTIKFDQGLIGQTIVVDQGQILLDQDKVINGPGLDLLSISANSSSRLFEIQNGVTVGIYGLTLRDAESNTEGGAILNRGTLILNNIEFLNCFEGISPKSITNLPGSTTTLEQIVRMKE